MTEKTSFKTWGWPLAVIAAVSLGLGALIQWISNAGDFWPGCLAATGLIFLSGAAMWLVWQRTGGEKTLAWMMALAFLLRLFLAVFLAWGLPQFGYDTEPQKAGFVFEDAFRRDESAWALAQSNDPLTRAFSDEYSRDQYGGMLLMSALVYRTISPDAYRPMLIVILTAAAIALSVPFLVAAARRQLGTRTAHWAGWILALYPEGILLGASQMREPFYILFISIIFWAAGHWLNRSRLKLILPAFVVSTLALFIFSYRVAIPAVGAVLLWVWVEELSRMQKSWQKIAGWGAVAVGAAVVLFIFRDWLSVVFNWDSYLTVKASGVVQFQLEKLPAWSHMPFIIVYGLFQPVLPAAIAAPAPWIWKSLAIFRAAGWYALLPLLIYGLFRVWKAQPAHKRLLMVFALASWTWALIASVRAGGDQWDNPRYRTIFLPWMAVVSAWGVQFAARTKDRWLWRWLIVEGVFLAFFTEWYLSRYVSTIPRMEFERMVVLIVTISLVILGGGWLRDRHHSKDDLMEQ